MQFCESSSLIECGMNDVGDGDNLRLLLNTCSCIFEEISQEHSFDKLA